VNIEVLPSLPAYGPMYVPFSDGATTHHSEGFVVKINMSERDFWIANFQNGRGSLSEAKFFDRTGLLLVSAKGNLFEINVLSRQMRYFHSTTVMESVELNSQVVFADWSDLFCFSENGLDWKTKQLGLDGISLEKVENGAIFGQVYDPLREEWNDFRVSIKTGRRI